MLVETVLVTTQFVQSTVDETIVSLSDWQLPKEEAACVFLDYTEDLKPFLRSCSAQDSMYISAHKTFQELISGQVRERILATEAFEKDMVDPDRYVIFDLYTSKDAPISMRVCKVQMRSLNLSHLMSVVKEFRSITLFGMWDESSAFSAMDVSSHLHLIAGVFDVYTEARGAQQVKEDILKKEQEQMKDKLVSMNLLHSLQTLQTSLSHKAMKCTSIRHEAYELTRNACAESKAQDAFTNYNLLLTCCSLLQTLADAVEHNQGEKEKLMEQLDEAHTEARKQTTTKESQCKTMDMEKRLAQLNHENKDLLETIQELEEQIQRFDASSNQNAEKLELKVKKLAKDKASVEKKYRDTNAQLSSQLNLISEQREEIEDLTRKIHSLKGEADTKSKKQKQQRKEAAQEASSIVSDFSSVISSMKATLSGEAAEGKPQHEKKALRKKDRGILDIEPEEQPGSPKKAKTEKTLGAFASSNKAPKMELFRSFMSQNPSGGKLSFSKLNNKQRDE